MKLIALAETMFISNILFKCHGHMMYRIAITDIIILDYTPLYISIINRSI